MLARVLGALLLALLSPFALAASSGQPLTPANVSVLGNDSRVFSARFFDALGNPAVGENVQFVNDACGTFPNGSPVINVRTDSAGVATTTFTAYAQGITCWLIAAAGAQVRFDVLTFTNAQVYFAATTNPLQPRPGQAFTVTLTPMAGLYKLYEQDVSARVVSGTAGAAVSPASASSGQVGAITFQVTPDNRVGDYDIEFSWRGRTQRLSMKAPANPWQDMWWGGSAENGWGVSVVQHADMLFSVIYAYDAAGKPTWFVMPGGTWNAARDAFSGPLFQPKGAPLSAYDASKFTVGASVGTATFTFNGGNSVVLDYAINGVTGRKAITRQMFGPQDTPATIDRGDMWWGGATQNGWGLALLQQYRTLFGVWFTYDAEGAPTWLVLPSGYWSDVSTYEGRVYRSSGSPWLGAVYDPSAFRLADVGSFRIRFSGDGGTFDYTVDGKSGTVPLSRQPF